MTNDPRFHGGGQEYGYQSQHQPSPPQTAAQPYVPPPPVEEYAPQPVMRPAPQGYAPQQLTPAMAAQHPAPMVAPPAHAPMVAVQTQAPVVAVPPTAPAAANDDDNLVILTRPYLAHDELVDRIRLRRPITRDIKQCGNPLRLDTAADGTILGMDIKWDVVAKYISLLASPPLPPSTVDQFDFFDLDACAAVIARFFVKLAP